MARVTFSPLITAMSGKTSDAVFARWKGTDYVRTRVTPENPKTAGQTAQRNALTHCLQLWQSIKAWATAHWDKYALAYGISGFNAYMQQNILHVKANAAEHLTPYNSAYAALTNPAAAAGTSGKILCTWTKRAGCTDDNVVRIMTHKIGTYAWVHHTFALETAQTYTIEGLTPGASYSVALAPRKESTNLYGEAYGQIQASGA